MESEPMQKSPVDPTAALALADQTRQRMAAQLQLPAGLHPALATAIAMQIGTAAYGVASQTVAGLVVALVGVAVFLAVASAVLYQFRRINGVRVDGLASQLLLGTSATSTLVYLCAFEAATWAAFGTHWWLVALVAIAGGVGYALGSLRWWRAYQEHPDAHAKGASLRVLAALAVVACLGLVALILAG